ncbi:hypothetical protein HX871_06795 [Pseudomonas reactans]|uniref:Uncharacterized protein n=1 Tax=Pseudomonas reactans TaxID=117680 RepID=A0ABX2QQM5_9PSED|nr:hypothetical protein [Pseudomonas reactans]NWA43781.1 hypothetical protein [Pseudomonas reactans]NWD29967.1 hypothetical protein [Pseudomonas reactans]NWD94117.1 hypothetical protein [Pseudomonas reactans]NWF12198.1 hypothetical protein [Pseudomonas reactans]
MTVEITEKKVSEIGSYQVIFKSGATAILDQAELWASFWGDEARVWYFQRDGARISFTSHVAGGEAKFDDVIDAILRLK